MKRLPKNIRGMDVCKLMKSDVTELEPRMASIVNESMYQGKGDVKHLQETYFTGEGAYIAIFDDSEVAAFAKIINLPETNTAYFSMLARREKYRGTGLFSTSILLSLGQGFEWGSEQVACVSANNRAVEIFAKNGFVYYSKDRADRELIADIARERFGKDAEIMDGFILNGTILDSYPNVPMYEPARTAKINALFGAPFERERCDRRLIFRRLDKKAENDYESWLRSAEQ